MWFVSVCTWKCVFVYQCTYMYTFMVTHLIVTSHIFLHLQYICIWSRFCPFPSPVISVGINSFTISSFGFDRRSVCWMSRTWAHTRTYFGYLAHYLIVLLYHSILASPHNDVNIFLGLNLCLEYFGICVRLRVSCVCLPFNVTFVMYSLVAVLKWVTKNMRPIRAIRRGLRSNHYFFCTFISLSLFYLIILKNHSTLSLLFRSFAFLSAHHLHCW